jgi:plastocyanin
MHARSVLTFAVLAGLAGLAVWGACCSGCSDGGDKPPARTPAPPDPATTGTVKGIVAFKGTPPERKPIQVGGDAACAQSPPPLEEHAIVHSAANGQVLQNAFVWIKGNFGKAVWAVPQEPVVVDQKKCIFVPHVVGVRQEQSLRFTNSDPTEHNVKFTETKGNPEHDWTMTGAGQSHDFWFPKEAVPPMRVICNKHSWMKMWVGVVDHPFFQVTGKDGAFDLSGIPAGTHVVACWSEAYGMKEQPVKVEAGGTAAIEFSFSPKE